MYRYVIKPSIDFVIALVILVLASPIIFITAFILFINNRGNPFFIQPRPGKKERIFRLIKFKTMNDRKDADGNLLPDADRLTHIGKTIRKISLDELPQLINVLKGDMSLVGPRPLLVQYLPLYNNRQRRRHDVKPGITGWAQVNGRNTIGWRQKFEYDVWYVDNMDFRLDFKIYWLTVIKVFRSDGINSDTSATMEPFTGN